MAKVLMHTRNAVVSLAPGGAIPLAPTTVSAWAYALRGAVETRMEHVVFSTVLNQRVPLRELQQLTETKLRLHQSSIVVKECTKRQALQLLFSFYGPERVKFHHWKAPNNFLSAVVKVWDIQNCRSFMLSLL